MPHNHFYSTAFDSDQITIDHPKEVHHLKNVIRCKEGDEIFIHDGCGRIAKAQIEKIKKTEAMCSVLEIKTNPPSKFQLHLIQGICKEVELIIEKATEIGIQSICLLAAKNSSISSVSPSKLEKLIYKSIVAMKQSGQFFLPEIVFYDSLSSLPIRGKLVLLDQMGEKNMSEADEEITYCVGPESGFTSEEKSQLLELGAISCSLGTSVLRCETAAICGCFLFKYLSSK